MANEVYYSTGRGGSGNIAHGPKSPEPQEGEQVGKSIPHLKQTVYTTGRGGIGNMRVNTSKEQARKAQDVDEPDRVIEPQVSNRSVQGFGRGGYGNIQAAKEAQQKEKKSFVQKALNLFRTN